MNLQVSAPRTFDDSLQVSKKKSRKSATGQPETDRNRLNVNGFATNVIENVDNVIEKNKKCSKESTLFSAEKVKKCSN